MNQPLSPIPTRSLPAGGDALSLLGFGCMRFPRKAGRIDQPAVDALLARAIQLGVNYFDTAWMYPGSEEAVGLFLSRPGAGGRPLREQVYLATKLAYMAVKDRPGMERMLQTSLERLRTDHIDYYLVHSLTSWADWEKLKELGIREFLREHRQSGRLRRLGFSWHGNLGDFQRVVDDFEWEFCQIQLNYLDEHFQAGIQGMRYAAGRGLGVMVMEPLRGGTLAGKLPPALQEALSRHPAADGAGRTPAYWGLRWVMDHPEVQVVLSGMNELSQLEENAATAAEALPHSLRPEDLALLEQVKQSYKARIKAPCTGCSYCMPCPHGVDIPGCFSAWNSRAMLGGWKDTMKYLMFTGGSHPSRASQCVGCGLCQTRCPQQIPIPARLAEASRELELPWLTLPVGVALKVLGR
ncbi:MAG: aldo/keto reductase [Clostridiales bacterium]|nr:aldo/keto reductase [Clostridiales bacterium]